MLYIQYIQTSETLGSPKDLEYSTKRLSEIAKTTKFLTSYVHLVIA